MNNEQWRTFLTTCARVLGPGRSSAPESHSWCAWTTFDALAESLHYWSAGVPAEHELGPSSVADGGTWGQPFAYAQLAHLIIPGRFTWERMGAGKFENGSRLQNIAELSTVLEAHALPHRCTDRVLEVKLY